MSNKISTPSNHAKGGANADGGPQFDDNKDAYLATLLRKQISVRGARTHNLKNIDVDIPRNQLVVITGLSGSGKSSLAFDTLYAEGQRRYVESLSTYARQFLQMMDKPDVDVIEGLSPAIAIEQKATNHNPRSTVGTITEIHDYLRLLFARAGTPYCPAHNLALQAQTISQMVDAVLALKEGSKWMIAAPIAREKKGEFLKEFEGLESQGFVRFRVDGVLYEAMDLPMLKKNEKHDIDVIVDRIKIHPKPSDHQKGQEENAEQWVEYDAQRQRLAESFETAVRIGAKRAIAIEIKEEPDSKTAAQEHFFNAEFACPQCNYSITELEPRSFSFNSPMGACPTCDGLGQQEFFDPKKVVPFPEISLEGGAIRGWDRRNAHAFSLMQSLAKHYQFDLQMPFQDLPQKIQDAILYGSAKEEIEFDYVMDAGAGKVKRMSKKHPFEGVLPSIERRYRETDSQALREDLAQMRAIRSCPVCHGTRLRKEARHVRVGLGEQSKAIFEISQMALGENLSYFRALKLDGHKGEIASKIIREIELRLAFLNDVGLNYLSLDRSADTLSGGESQRIRLASQIGTGLTGVMYVLDEPSIGLHQRDNDRLIASLIRLRNLGNSVLVVEHDEDMMRAADTIIDMGPGAGTHGGEVQAIGDFAGISANEASLTGQYLSGKRSIAVPKKRIPWKKDAFGEKMMLRIVNATGNNLKSVTAEIPVGLFTCVTGVSGSGKSTLINDTLYAQAAFDLNRASTQAASHDTIEGLAHFDKVIDVDQSPIGRTPRSNPATYTGLFTPIRDLMASMSISKERGYNAGRFSFNVAGGRCESCQGDGVIKVEMHFLPDMYVPCDVCKGLRYNRETLDVRFKGKNITEILDLTVEEALEHFASQPAIARKLKTLMDVGLSYITLGQSATTLSGGEAQRVKLSLELSKRATGKTLYILDEPTTGLHFADIELLLKVLHQLRDTGNTVVLIEHNLDVIKTADWIVDMGPEGGKGGGQILCAGTPEEVTSCEESFTGQYLKRYLHL